MHVTVIDGMPAQPLRDLSIYPGFGRQIDADLLLAPGPHVGGRVIAAAVKNREIGPGFGRELLPHAVRDPKLPLVVISRIKPESEVGVA